MVCKVKQLDYDSYSTLSAMSSKEIQIEMFPAGNGDAILISLGKSRILVDGGYSSTYKRSLKLRLEEIAAEGGTLSHIIVTHIDADHISGIIKLLQDNGMHSSPQVIPIGQIWHNSYRHLYLPDKIDGEFASDSKPDVEIPTKQHIDDADEASQDVSFRQGTSLGATILEGGYKWNNDFHGKAVSSDISNPVRIDEDLTLTVLSPTYTDLEKMGKKWLDEISKWYDGELNEDAFFDDAFEKLMDGEKKPSLQRSGRDVSGGRDWVTKYLPEWNESRDEDNSITNGSSITFLIEYKDKKFLFLGDAIPSKVYAQLALLNPGLSEPFHVDVLKVAHHGSLTNNSPNLLNMVHADHYLFSSNGKRHHHPHFETLSLIVRSNPEKLKKFYFNYYQERFRILKDYDMQVKYNYEVYFPEKRVKGYLKLEL